MKDSGISVEIPEDVNSLATLCEILKEEYSIRCARTCRFFNQDGCEITEGSLILVKDNELVYIEPSLEKGFDFTIILSQYQILGKLGQGGFGKVFKAQHKISKSIVAVKYIDIRECSMY